MGISVNGIPILGIPGIGVPPGGTGNQVLAKKSNANYDTEWVNQTGTTDIEVATEEKIGGVLSSSGKGKLSVSESGESTINDNVIMDGSGEIILNGVGNADGPHTIEITPDPISAAVIGYDDSVTELGSNTVQGAIESLDTKIKDNNDNIDELTVKVDNNTQSISTNTTNITTNTNNISSIQNRISYYSNPNLFDNGYFLNPINQRNLTEYKVSNSRLYTIDRWFLNKKDNSPTLNVTSSGVVLTNDINGSQLQFVQIIDPVYNSSLLNKKVTISFLTTDILLSQTFIIPESIGPNIAIYYSILVNEKSFYVVTDGSSQIHCGFQTVSTNPVTLIAAKLELGSQQTLAHQDTDGMWVLNEVPNYEQELAKCQRYMQIVGGGNSVNIEIASGFAYYITSSLLEISLQIPLNVQLRITPVAKINNALRFVYANKNNNYVGAIVLSNSKITSPIYVDGSQNICNVFFRIPSSDFENINTSYFQVDSSGNTSNYILLDANL